MKKMALPEDNTDAHHHQLEATPLALDGLFCDEESFEFEECCIDAETERCEGKESPLPPVLQEHDLFWDDNELLFLICKEKKDNFVRSDPISDEILILARKEVVEWVFRVKAHFGFTALTAVLAVNYFDRFILSHMFQKDKPWMGQLVAVACLSLAAKVDETQVPLLLDLQVKDPKYVFEAKTIQRMELLVLSTLQWRMNPVTPISFFDHIVRRLGLKTHLHWEFLYRCEHLLLPVIADSRFMCYLPSTLATATMLHTIQEVEPCNPVEHQNLLMGVLNISQDKVKECYLLILELSRGNGSPNQSCKRKHLPLPGSPSGIIDANFSCDSSNDSWPAASLFSSPPEPRFKRSRIHVQQMRLSSLTRTFVDVLSSPR